ncbi:unnamed protein product [Clavelina lepadiformis]|uniref:ABC-type glutathione-S-conjugate transporter n=2 Tax=Clavelina lepadiformis TaxID=159417 RepID=A0ABP0FYU3_CLALP
MNLTVFCGNEDFFDPNEVFNSSNPKLSLCFQHTVLDLTPCAYMLIFSVPYYFVYRNSKDKAIRPSKLFTARMIFTSVLFLLALANFGYGIWKFTQTKVGLVYIISPCLLAIGMAKAIFFLNFDRKKGIQSSGLLTCFWIWYLVLWALIFKSQVDKLLEKTPLNESELFRCVTFFISYSCVLALFIMCFFVDHPRAHTTYDPYSDESQLLQTETNIEEEIFTEKNPCPEPTSSFLSKIFFQWFSSLIVLGYKRPLMDGDLWDLRKSDKAGRVSRHFLSNWNKEKEKRKQTLKFGNPKTSSNGRINDSGEEVLIEQPVKSKEKGPSFFKALVKTFGPYFIISSFLKVLNDVLTFVSPQLLRAMIQFTTDEHAPVWKGYVLAALMFVSAVFLSIVQQQYFNICFTVGMRMRSAIVAAVYRKALVMSNAARKQSTVGEVVNLMSVDAQRFMDLMPFINIIWSGPFQIILAMYFLYTTMGASIFAGFGVMILLFPINGIIASKAHKYQVEQMKLKDERIKIMNEVLNGIKVLKMYAWELSFREKINSIRKREVRVLRNTLYLNAAASFTWTCAPFLVSLTTFAVYVLSSPNHVLTAEKAFVSISLFNILQFPLLAVPIMIAAVVQASVSLNRIQKYLNGDELDPTNVEHSSEIEAAISVDNATFSWEKDEEPTLQNISFTVPKGSLVAVVGQVGCGKSSLINCLLGNMEKIDGQVFVNGSVAYVAQQAWIQNLTVSNNILFGKALEEDQYRDVVKACELKEDFEMLPAGDQTEIGEKGINLSGGQKQRVSIARAVYQDKQIYLLDDPLSAVDAHVGKNIFENVFGPQGCLKSKTRILVTHGVSFLHQVDKIVVMTNGRISEVGTYDELLKKDGDFAEFIRNFVENGENEVFDEETNDSMTSSPPATPLNGDSVKGSVSSMSGPQQQRNRLISHQQSRISESERSRKNSVLQKQQSIEKESQQYQEKDKLITTEAAEVGNIKLSVLFSYMKAVGYFTCIIIVLAYMLSNAASVSTSIWLSAWSNDPINEDGSQNKTSYRLTVYGLLGLTQSIFVLVSSFALSFGSVLASVHLHSRMLSNLLKAPMSFFDTTPLGRIINRFSKDIYLIDEVVPQSLSSFFQTFFMVISTFVVVTYSTPIFAAVIVPVLILYWFVQRFYVRTSRQLKRLESISRSPIYSHFSETLSGATTIRAYGLQTAFIKQNEIKVDTNQTAYYPNFVSNRWLSVRLQIVGNLIVLFAAIFAVVEKGTINAGIVGLSISYASQVTQILTWIVRSASEIETNIVAVERVEEYANVKQEAPLEVEDSKPDDSWPHSGEINFLNYSTRYRDELDLVIHGINVDIKGGEKVGVVGRTGAGKSSLTLSLFRIIEAVEGMITIDGVDIRKIGLHSLRSKLSIIPQDPVLFCGTLRMNLDPFEAYSDDEIWNALEYSHLKQYVSSLAKQLDHDVAEGGENLSVGQRQLVCLARALLQKSKILILDEATAAVDLETDDLIQTTIRDKFADCTVFTIAHRLNTVMDSTRVLVLEAGKVVEYDSPDKLLKKKGLFHSMAEDAGLVT